MRLRLGYNAETRLSQMRPREIKNSNSPEVSDPRVACVPAIVHHCVGWEAHCSTREQRATTGTNMKAARDSYLQYFLSGCQSGLGSLSSRHCETSEATIGDPELLATPECVPIASATNGAVYRTAAACFRLACLLPRRLPSILGAQSSTAANSCRLLISPIHSGSLNSSPGPAVRL